jgi:hypothetical protein
MSTPLSRRASGHPLGKCDDEIKAPVPEALAEMLRKYASEREKTLSEAARDLFTDLMCGALFGVRAKLGIAEGSAPISLEQALDALAMLHGMSRDEYQREVLKAHVFGIHEPSLAQAMSYQKGRNRT